MNPSVLLERLSSAEEAKSHYIPGGTARGSGVLWLQDQNIAREGERMTFFSIKCSKFTDEDEHFHHFPSKTIGFVVNKSLICCF